MIDVALPNTQPTSSPHVAEFVTRVLERLKPLTSEPEIHNHVREENTQETDERTQAVKLLKTGQNVKLRPGNCVVDGRGIGQRLRGEKRNEGR